ncbi:MAG: hypothetical protein EOP52_06690 [Sphingobacteriales bacterium]|nr:MAG: hypothetical protein EOP52_06690 [Sphingobacteriales bacterium]
MQSNNYSGSSRLSTVSIPRFLRTALSVLALMVLALLVPDRAQAQRGTKIGGTTSVVDSSAGLELAFFNKGFLPPSLTSAQRDAIVLPAPGLVVLNSTLNCLQVNTGSAVAPVWQCLVGGGATNSVGILAEVLEGSTSPGGAGNANGRTLTAAQLNQVATTGGATTANQGAYNRAIFRTTTFSNPPTASQVQGLIDSSNRVVNTLLTQIGAQATSPTQSSTTTVAQLDSMGIRNLDTANEKAYQKYIDQHPGSFGPPTTVAQVQQAIDETNALVTRNLAQIAAQAASPTQSSTTTVAQLDSMGIRNLDTANEKAYQKYIDQHPGSFSNPATVAQVQQAVDATNALVTRNLAQIAAQAASPTVASTTTVAQLDSMGIQNLDTANEKAYQKYIDQHPGSFGPPTTIAQVQQAINETNAIVTRILTQISTQAASPTVASTTTVAQLDSLGIQNVTAANDSLYRRYIDDNPGSFTAPRATVAQVQTAINNVNAAVPTSNGTALVAGYTCSTDSTGALLTNTPVSGVTQTLTANVTRAGTYKITTSTANGVTYVGSGTFAGTGLRTIVLTASGTPTNAAGTNSTFTLNTTPGCSFSRTTLSGATYTAGTLACGGALSGTYQVGRPITGSSNTKVVTVTVATTGGYSISTPVVRGVRFSASGTFTSTGSKSVTLVASGTPDTSGTIRFTVTAGAQSCQFDVPFIGAAVFNFDAAKNTFSPAGLLTTNTAYSGTYTLPYTAGNGSRYDTLTLGPINGLTLTRVADSLKAGGDSVRYTLSGTYTGATGGSVSFILPEGGYIGVPSRYVTTFAGTYGVPGTADSTGTAARFRAVTQLAFDGSGNLYVTDNVSHTIRKITPARVVTTFAGVAGTSGASDGTGTSAYFYQPFGVGVDDTGNLYIGDAHNDRIRKITPSKEVTTFAGSTPGYTDATGTAAKFSSPAGTAVDGSGNVYVADFFNSAIRMITPAKVVTTFAGGTQGSANGTGTAAQFNRPFDVAFDGSGNLYVVDRDNHRIRKITPSKEVTTFAGSTQGYTDATGTAAQFNNPSGIGVDGRGNVYVADNNNGRIRKITPAGVVTTFAGASSGTTGDGPATAVQLGGASDVAVDSSGNVYVGSSNRILKITP